MNTRYVVVTCNQAAYTRSHVRRENRHCRERIHSSQLHKYSFDVLVATLIVNSELVMSCHVHNVDQRIFECNCKSINCFVERPTQATCAEIRSASVEFQSLMQAHVLCLAVFITSETKKYRTINATEQLMEPLFKYSTFATNFNYVSYSYNQGTISQVNHLTRL